MTVTPPPPAVTRDVAGVTRDVADGAGVAGEKARRVADEEVRRVAAQHGVTPAELVQRLRDVVTGIARDASHCDWCEGPMPRDASPTQRYCDDGCRKKASHYRVARRRIAAERKARGEQLGSCDVCGAACDVDDALCDRCIDGMNERYRAAMEAAQAELDAEEDPHD